MSSTIISRLKLDHPDLGTPGGAGLHAAISALYTKLGDSIDSRFLPAVGLASGASVDLEHNFKCAFADLRWDLYTLDTGTGALVRITSSSTPAKSAFTVAAKTGAETTHITVTNSSGASRDLVLIVYQDPIELGELIDIDLSTAAPQDGQALVYDLPTSKWRPGASGDASFKIQSVSGANATLKGGYLMLDDGREVASYSGTGSTSASFGVDLTVNLNTVLGATPQNATSYYLYIDISTLPAATTTTDTGRKLFGVTVSNLVLSTNTPDRMDPARYIPRGLVRSANTGNAWSGTGSSFRTLSFLKASTIAKRTAGTFQRVNYVANPDAEVSVDGVSVYKNAAQATPVTGAGGSPSLTVTRNTTNPLCGVADFKLSKPASNCQGEGWAFDVVVPKAFRNGRKGEISLLLDTTHANIASGDLAIYVYDVTAGKLIVPSTTTLWKMIDVLNISWDSNTDSSQYRLLIHVATTNAAAFDLFVDNVVVGPGQAVYGGGATAVDSYTPTLVGFGTVSNLFVEYWGDGEVGFFKGYFTAGTPTAVTATMSLPPGMTLLTPGNIAQSIGEFQRIEASPIANTNKFGKVLGYPGVDGTKVYFGVADFAQGQNATANTGNNILSTGDSMAFSFAVRIKEWAGRGSVALLKANLQSPATAGFIQPFAGSTAPAGWALCDGSALDKTQYSQLYARIGNAWDTAINTATGAAYAAPGGNLFRLPDLRGVFVRGAGTSVNTSGTNSQSTTLAGFQNENIGTHTHSVSVDTGADPTSWYARGPGVASGSSGGIDYYISSRHTHNSTGTAASSGTLGTTETRPRNVGVNHIIKLYDDMAGPAYGLPAATADSMGLFKAGHAPATNTNDDAAAGEVGEVIVQHITSQVQTSTVDTPVDAAQTITLTKGHWDLKVDANVYITSGASFAGGMVYGHVQLTDAANTEVYASCFGVYLIANQGSVVPVSFAVPVKPAANTTYKMRLLINRTNNSTGAQGNILPSGTFSGAVRAGSKYYATRPR